MTDFDPFFRRIAALPDRDAPHDWQRELAFESEARSRLIRVPTGMGKTLGVLAGWAWNRLIRRDDRWPRRLVWCLPMRVLVEQTQEVVREALERLGLVWDGLGPHDGKVGVHVLMGGADPGADWNLYPEECAVLIGTQDMLLSRALNRGYASGRARWPLEFGLLSHDALWVMDEVQLMDVGLATSAQLQAYHDDDAARGFRPRHTWWMSATLQPRWLRSVDTERRHGAWVRDPTRVSAERRAEGLGAISKALATASTPADDAKGLAALALSRHAELTGGAYGRITLVVCNTVERARSTFEALSALAPNQEIRLVHSRFRGFERAAWRASFLNRSACNKESDRIIVATQVVEAGVDISAGCVVTELAPWPSLVQRFGRCARYGGTGSVVVVDRGRDDKVSAPYAAAELEAAQEALAALAARASEVGTAALEEFEEGLDEGARERLYPYEPRNLLLRRELDELFDTTADLTGADLDISRFIRSGDERDVLVYWLEVPAEKSGEPPKAPPRRAPGRDELCAVPFLRAREWLCGKETGSSRKPRLRPGVRAWTWDWVDGEWAVVDRAKLTPGRVVCVAADVGGYDPGRGFDPRSGPVTPVPPQELSADAAAQAESEESEDSEALSATQWKTIACHGAEVASLADRIGAGAKLPDDLRAVLVLAGRWHDYGKAHPAFQGAIRHAERPAREDLAKAPPSAWPRPPMSYRTRDGEARPGLRHELASALALFAILERHAPEHPALLGPWAETLALLGEGSPEAAGAEPPTPDEKALLDCTADELDLLAYLVASHHGKVRVALHAGPKDQEYRDRDGRGLPIRGVRERDALPPVCVDADAPPIPALTLTLEPATLGLSSRTGRSWRERTASLQERFGPGALAWLEALFIAADRRASRLETPDPLLIHRSEVNR